MDERFARTALLLGGDGMEKLARARVAVFGVGGVGGYVVEALARSGVGALDLIDNDTVALSNLNRQIVALESTVGMNKVDAAKERVLSINPHCAVRTFKTFFLPENADAFDFSVYDYIVDAIDTVSAKIALVLKARAGGVPIISSMGTGNKLDPARLRISDISKTSVCPLARVMRTELRRRGVNHLKVVWSDEEPIRRDAAAPCEAPAPGKRSVPGSSAFVPPAAGLLIASEIVRDLVCAKAPDAETPDSRAASASTPDGPGSFAGAPGADNAGDGRKERT